MADTAYQIQYRQEFIAGFEQKQTNFRTSTTTEVMIKGNQATFLIADTGGASAVTRGVNGKIPARSDNLTQKTATLEEWHDKPQRTRFNIFGSQGDGRRILQLGTTKVLNRKVDDLIITELSTATNDTGASQIFSLNLIMKALAILGLNDVEVEDEDNLFCAISPAALAYLMQLKEFTSADYVEIKPLNGPAKRMRRWAGVNWFTSNRLSGRTTATEKCLLYHRDAIGYAVDNENMNVGAGYNDEDDYYYARASGFMGAKLLQNAGVVVINHDGSAYVAS
jgi:Phage capsid protein